MASNWFKSYLCNRKQFVSVNGYISNQTSVIYINDLNHAIKFCKVHHFTDDTNLLHFSKSVNKLNKYINLDMKNLTDRLNANKISLNVEKTELVIFKHKKKKLECPIRIKLSRKRLYPSYSIKYLGVKIDENLNWKNHIHLIARKLNRANALLFKIRNYGNQFTLQSLILI